MMQVLVVLCRPDINKGQAKLIGKFLSRIGHTEAEFYVWGDKAMQETT